MSNLPVALLAFANDRENPGRFLETLSSERRSLDQLFDPQKQAGEIHVRVSDGGVANLVEDVQKMRDSLLIFHFAGHANGQALQLEHQTGKGESLAGANLVSLLGASPGLQLVFLNACATRAHVAALLNAGIKTVIATDTGIDDGQASVFSKTFYKGLLGGQSLRRAFEDARVAIEGHSGQPRIHRGIGLESAGKPDDFPWGFYCPDPKGDDWSLADARQSRLRARLRAGSNSRYEELRGPGGRFEHLDISEVLLTSLHKHPVFETDVKLGEERLGSRESLKKLWDMNPPHSIVQGDGGMGKTVSLLLLWERFLEEEQGPVPIFVQLNEFNQATTENREHWLTWYIARHYLGERPVSKETEQQLWSWLEADWDRPYPKLILLLDGFNEISVDTRSLLIELQEEWRGKAEGIQILLSSRYEINLTWAKDFQRLELQPLDEARAGAYLQDRGLPWPGPDQPDLRRLLCNPMMLTLYAATSEFLRDGRGSAGGFKPNASTGELMWNFIHAQTLKFEAIHNIEEENVHLYRWLIWQVLPALGYEMELRGQFSFSRQELKEAVEACLAQFNGQLSDLMHLFPECQRTWEKIEREGAQAYHFQQVHEQLLRVLRMLKEEAGAFAFLHQNFRDFFAALHLRNSLVLDVDRKRPPGLLIPRALSIYLRRMLGEIEGEHHNAARLQGRRWNIAHQQPNLLTRALDGCRGLHGPQRPGLAVFNLLEMVHEVRGEWTGLSIHDLDLY